MGSFEEKMDAIKAIRKALWSVDFGLYVWDGEKTRAFTHEDMNKLVAKILKLFPDGHCRCCAYHHYNAEISKQTRWGDNPEVAYSDDVAEGDEKPRGGE